MATSSRSSRWLVLIISLALAAVLALSACGGGDDDDDAGNANVTVTATDDTGDDGGDEAEPTDTDDEAEPTDEPDGDDESDEGDDAVGDACALLTEDEAEQVLGAPVAAVEPFDQDPFAGCSWYTDSFDSVDVELGRRDPEGESLYEFLSEDAEEVDGLGDRAHYVSGALTLLEVLDGDYYISVSVDSIELSDVLEQEGAISLAGKALERLP
jgi:hypothetical protein